MLQHKAQYLPWLTAGHHLGGLPPDVSPIAFQRARGEAGMNMIDWAEKPIPWFGARKMAQGLQSQVRDLRSQIGSMRTQFEELGALSILDLDIRRKGLEREIESQIVRLEKDKADAANELANYRDKMEAEAAFQNDRLEKEKAAAVVAVEVAKKQLGEIQKGIVKTEDTALLQEVGVYSYRHPLTDVVSYETRLASIEESIKAMTRKDGGAVTGTTNWSVNGSASAGRAMVRDFSKLMLRAFNSEADNLVRGLKPYKLDSAKDRLAKVADVIVRLGKTMDIRISPEYYQLRILELELTADYLEKVAEEKELERKERERLKEERKVQQEIERERLRLEKERRHYDNALEILIAKGDEDGAARIREQLADVDKAIEDVDYRAANIRAGYVYLISNIGSFGERMVKVGLTRRLDPLERIKELSDASVPFNFDVHAIFFSKDAVGIETAMHERLADVRVNLVNRRREFFHATPMEVKAHLAELAGELLQFQEMPEALEYRQCLVQRRSAVT